MTVEKIISSVASRDSIVLSAGDNPVFNVDLNNRSKVAFVKSNENIHILLIARSYRLDSYVMSYKDRVERKVKDISVIICNVADINNINHTNGNDNLSKKTTEETTTQKMVLKILKEATQINSSDVHFIVNKGHCNIRFRSKGNLVDSKQLSVSEGMALCAAIYQSMSDVAEPTFRPTQAQRSRISEAYLGNIGLTGARVNTRPLDGGFLMVLRLFYAESSIKKMTLQSLGYLPSQCDELEMLSKHKAGIVLISGATGSGKSTTLKTIMDKQISEDPGMHVLTLEDPPEYVIKGANQSPVMGDRNDALNTELVWGQAISDAMRLDPDIIMIGEVRDSVSAKMAFRAAMTGHLVWTTIHANTAMTIMYRLQDEGVSSSLLTDESILLGLVNQSLVLTLCQHCKVPIMGNEKMISADLLKRVDQCGDRNGIFINGPGCNYCNGSSNSGRTIVAEIINTNAGFMSTYRDKGHANASHYWLQKMSGIKKMDAALIKMSQGILSPIDIEKALGPLERSHGFI